MRGLRLYIIIAACGLFLFNIATCLYSMKEFNLNGRYIIATIDSVKTRRYGKDVIFLSYRFNNTNHRYETDGSAYSYSIGQRIFIKVPPNGNANDAIETAADCPVPDTIQNEPANGWDKEWMKKNFPDCYLVKALFSSK